MGRDGEEESFDGVEGAVGEDVDCVDDVVEEGLGGGLLGYFFFYVDWFIEN